MAGKRMVAVLDEDALIAAMVALTDKAGAFREHAQKAVTPEARDYAEKLVAKLERAHDALMTAQELGRNAGALGEGRG